MDKMPWGHRKNFRSRAGEGSPPSSFRSGIHAVATPRIFPERRRAEALLRELVEMENQRGAPERWDRIEGRAEEIRHAIRRMDGLQELAGTITDDAPVMEWLPVHKSAWRSLTVAYRERKNRLIAEVLGLD